MSLFFLRAFPEAIPPFRPISRSSSGLRSLFGIKFLFILAASPGLRSWFMDLHIGIFEALFLPPGHLSALHVRSQPGQDPLELFQMSMAKGPFCARAIPTVIFFLLAYAVHC